MSKSLGKFISAINFFYLKRYFPINTVKETEVLKLIVTLNLNKSLSSYSIPVEVLKDHADSLKLLMTQTFFENICICIDAPL